MQDSGNSFANALELPQWYAEAFMAECKAVVTALLTHWSYDSLAPNHWYHNCQLILAYRHHMATKIWVNIGSGNSLLPDGTKPLPETMLTDHQWSPVTFILGQFHKGCHNHQSLKSIWKYISKISFKFPRGQWVKLPSPDHPNACMSEKSTSIFVVQHQSEIRVQIRSNQYSYIIEGIWDCIR